MARKQSRLKFKPTPISRLLKQKYPIKMVGDPCWSNSGTVSQVWRNREQAVYEDVLIAKRGGWTNGMYDQAQKDNGRIDYFSKIKWEHHDVAWEEVKWADYENAVRDHATWEYEREYLGAGTEYFDTAA